MLDRAAARPLARRLWLMCALGTAVGCGPLSPAEWSRLADDAAACEVDDECVPVDAPRCLCDVLVNERHVERLERLADDVDCSGEGIPFCANAREGQCVQGRCAEIPDTRDACQWNNQTGCADDQKCVIVIDPAPTHTECVPNGSQEAGQLCQSDPDDCRAGLSCAGGLCRRHCLEPCPDSGACVPVTHYEESSTNGATVCATACDPIAQDCPGAGEACYVIEYQGTASCLPLPPDPGVYVQDVSCHSRDDSACGYNSCQLGHGPHLPDQTFGSARCAYYCTPSSTDAAGDPAGIRCDHVSATRPDGPGPGYECRIGETFLGFEPPIGVGVCVNATEFGSCADATGDPTDPPGCP